MNGKNLLDKMELVDAAYLAQAETVRAPKLHRALHNGAVAACAVLAAAVGAVLLLPHLGQEIPGLAALRPSATPTQQMEEDALVGGQVATSQVYGSFEALLLHLGRQEDHSARNDVIGSVLSRGEQAVVCGQTLCSIQDAETVTLSQNGTVVGQIHLPEESGVAALAAWERRLAVACVKTAEMGSGQSDETRVYIYDLTQPAQPTLLQNLWQSGGLQGCYAANGALYLLTADGVCACGFGAGDAPQRYTPQLRVAGEEVPFAPTELHVLDEPSALRYHAMTCIDGQSLAVRAKAAWYGDVQRFAWEEEGFALVTQTHTNTRYTPPTLYTFSVADLTCTAVLTPAAWFALPQTVQLQQGVLPQGTYLEMADLRRTGDRWQLLGTLCTHGEPYWSRQLFAATVHTQTGTVEKSTCALPEEQFTLDDVLWEEKRAILSTGSHTQAEDDLVQHTRLTVVDFAACPVFTPTALTVPTVSGIEDVFWLSSPLGQIRPFLSLGQGLYLRYNGIPDAFDLYDLRDPANAQCLAQGLGLLNEGERYDLQGDVAADGTVTVGVLLPGADGTLRSARRCRYQYRLQGLQLVLLQVLPAEGDDTAAQ